MFGTIGFKWYSRIYKKRSQLLINEYSWLRLVTKMLEPVSPHKQAQRLGQSNLLRFFFQRTCRFPRTRQPGSPGPQPQASQSHPHVISTAATHTCHAIGSRKRMHRTAQERAQNRTAEGTGPHKRTRKARATRRTAQRSRRHWPA